MADHTFPNADELRNTVNNCTLTAAQAWAAKIKITVPPNVVEARAKICNLLIEKFKQPDGSVVVPTAYECSCGFSCGTPEGCCEPP